MQQRGLAAAAAADEDDLLAASDFEPFDVQNRQAFAARFDE